MKTHQMLAIISMLVLIILSACGAPQVVSEPTPTSIPGWTKFEAENLEIWLPDSFIGGNLENDLDVIVDKLSSLGGEYEPIVNMIKSNPSLFLIWTYDSNIGDTGFLTSLNITHEQVVSAVTLDAYVDAVEKQLPSSFTITSQKNVTLGPNEAIQLIIEMDESGMTAKESMYMVKVANTIYALTYATGVEEFDQRLPVFEQSASTFSIQP